MGCCSKKRAPEGISIQLIEENLNKFSVQDAREIIRICIEEDYKYKILLDEINYFSDELIEKLFFGNMQYFEDNNIFLLKKEMKFLLMKLEDFHTILYSWYKDKSKYEYIKCLWLKNLCIYSLVEKSEDELNEQLNEIFQNLQFSKNYQDDLYELKQLIKNSPESAAMDINNYLKEQHPDYYSLVDISIEKHNKMKKECEKNDEDNNYYYSYSFKKKIEKERENKDTFCKKGKEIINKLISNAAENLEGIKKKIPDKIKNSKLFNIVDKEIKKRIWDSLSQPKPLIDTNQLGNLIGNLIKGNFIQNILKDTCTYFQNPLVGISFVACSFLNLYDSVSTFYEDCLIFEEKKTEFEERLEEIHSNFEYHVGQMNNFNLERMSIKEAENLLLKIGAEVEEDRRKMSILIGEIDDAISQIKKKNKKNYLKIAGTLTATIGCGIGIVLTGGALGVALGVGAAVNTIATGVNSAKVVKNKKTLKDFKDLHKKANEKYNTILKQINSIKDRYEQLQNEYIPVNIFT